VWVILRWFQLHLCFWYHCCLYVPQALYCCYMIIILILLLLLSSSSSLEELDKKRCYTDQHSTLCHSLESQSVTMQLNQSKLLHSRHIHLQHTRHCFSGSLYCHTLTWDTALQCVAPLSFHLDKFLHTSGCYYGRQKIKTHGAVVTSYSKASVQSSVKIGSRFKIEGHTATGGWSHTPNSIPSERKIDCVWECNTGGDEMKGKRVTGAIKTTNSTTSEEMYTELRVLAHAFFGILF
jgi:hypothetical protein